MAGSREMRKRIYDEYMRFFEVAERKRRWNIWDDIPWEKLNPDLNEEADAVRIESFCGVELYVPDYTAHGLNLMRDDFGYAWFAANWGYEESKHALVFREFLTRSGMRTEDEYLDYEEKIFSKVWRSPAATARQTAIYGAFQEIATYHIYHQQLEKARKDDNAVLEAIFQFVGRDEAAHAGFYRKAVLAEMDADPEGTMNDLAHVVLNFEMPGAPLIPDYEQRVLTEGVGLTKEQFINHALLPTIRHFGTTRSELMKTIRQQRAKAKEAA